MSGIQLVALAPHPPIIIASVGRGDREKVARTVTAMEELSREIAALDPDTIVLISPHGPIFQDAALTPIPSSSSPPTAPSSRMR